MNTKSSYILNLSIWVILVTWQGNARASWHFDPTLLNTDVSKVGDLDYLETGNDLSPGHYQIDLVRNKTFIDREDIQFQNDESSHQLVPCFTANQVEKLGLNLSAFPELQKTLNMSSCANILPFIEGSQTTLDISRLRLDISVPQIALKPKIRGLIPEEKWDNGISALMLNYNFSGGNTFNKHQKSTNDYYLNLRSSINSGPWRLHNYSTWRYSNLGEKQWSNISSYVERPIISLQSTLNIGDSYSNGDVLDSFNFRGVQLASDENMLPDALRGFAPTIRGIAQSQARVTIRQNNNVIYQTWVSPGAFSITDLYPTSSSGDLMVTVRE